MEATGSTHIELSKSRKDKYYVLFMTLRLYIEHNVLTHFHVCKHDVKVEAKLPRGTKRTNSRRGDKKRASRVEGNMFNIQYLLEQEL